MQENNKLLKGEAKFNPLEHDLELAINHEKMGHAIISGCYIERQDIRNKLHFEIYSDQSYIAIALDELKNYIESINLNSD